MKKCSKHAKNPGDLNQEMLHFKGLKGVQEIFQNFLENLEVLGGE